MLDLPVNPRIAFSHYVCASVHACVECISVNLLQVGGGDVPVGREGGLSKHQNGK